MTSFPAVRGVGLGFRSALAEEFLAAAPESMPALSFLEVHPENVMRRGGLHARQFAAVAERWPLLKNRNIAELLSSSWADAWVDYLKR